MSLQQFEKKCLNEQVKLITHDNFNYMKVNCLEAMTNLSDFINKNTFSHHTN